MSRSRYGNYRRGYMSNLPESGAAGDMNARAGFSGFCGKKSMKMLLSLVIWGEMRTWLS
jgi:hypothetical protein